MKPDPFLDGDAFLALLERPATPLAPTPLPTYPLTLRHLANTSRAVLRRYRGTPIAVAGARTVTQHPRTLRFVLREASAHKGTTALLDVAQRFLLHLPETRPLLVVLAPRDHLRHAIRAGDDYTLCGKPADLWRLDTSPPGPSCRPCLRLYQEQP